jgi:hypothetical protein
VRLVWCDVGDLMIREYLLILLIKSHVIKWIVSYLCIDMWRSLDHKVT